MRAHPEIMELTGHRPATSLWIGASAPLHLAIAAQLASQPWWLSRGGAYAGVQRRPPP